MHTPESILKSTFGYDTFKPLQREIITNVQARRDTLVIMPTGGGKSLTYQVPALLFNGLTVVVSPLIALMKDQVEQLNALGVPRSSSIVHLLLKRSGLPDSSCCLLILTLSDNTSWVFPYSVFGDIQISYARSAYEQED